MTGFRNFFVASVKGHNQNAPTEPTKKWDVVLFVGEYNPITKDEYERIKQFVAKVINGDQAEKFCHDVDLGVLVNKPSDEESFFEEKQNYNLTTDEKEFITSKLFGLKMFPVSFKQLMWLTLEQLDRDNTEGAKEKINEISEKIQSSFEKANILIVLRESDSHSLTALGEIIHKFSNDNINIGFMVWSHTPIKANYMENISCDGDMIKAVCLMDFERPAPDELKSFSYKYRLSKHLDSIRNIHFKVQGEKYLYPFMTMFPDLVIYGDEENEDKKNNYVFVMEMLKKMYLGDEYENRIQTREEEKNPKITGGNSSGIGGSGGGFESGGSMGGATSGPDTDKPSEDTTATPEADAGAPEIDQTATSEIPDTTL